MAFSGTPNHATGDLVTPPAETFDEDSDYSANDAPPPGYVPESEPTEDWKPDDEVSGSGDPDATGPNTGA